MPLTSFATAFALGRPPEKPTKLIPPVPSTATAPDLKQIIFGPPRPLGPTPPTPSSTEEGSRTPLDEMRERDDEFHHPKTGEAPKPVPEAPRSPKRPTTMEPPNSWTLKDRFGVMWYGPTKEGVESWVARRNAQTTWYSYGQVPAGTCYGGRCGR